MSEETLQIVVPSDEESRKAIRDAMQEMCDSYLRVAAEQTLQKEIAATMKEKYGIPTSVFNKWSRIHFKQNAQAILQEADEIVSTYELLTGKKDDGHQD